ncbi:hypothetical protein RF55_12004 [Lasius niger]|uniref:Uncharacterized protein n=1 Tax=Lasius niger TaxID=67767 RepID=A0A0J7KDG6_LASNI|nr:hypothetical protein RF55_12004 [Lasius niger]
MRGKVEELERKLEEVKLGMREKDEVREGRGEWKKRMKEVERKLEMKEREERRKNIVLRGIKGGREVIEKEMEGIMKEVGVITDLKGIKRIGGKEGEGGIVIVRMRDLGRKKELMIKKNKFRERGIRIEDDLTWRERKMKWKLEDIARQEREKGKRVWTSYGKLQIEVKWWFWDEKEMLKDGGAGVDNKDKEFWEGLEDWDVVILMETWLDGKGWERIRERLPDRYTWKTQLAKRKNKKGRACGGMLLGIKKDVLIKKKGSREEEEGRMECTVKIGEIRWRVVGVYVNENMEKKLESL